MKIVAIAGSPRQNGTSSRISDSFMNTAKRKGAETTTYHLNHLTYKGCQGCDACKGMSPVCIQKDDLTNVLHDLSIADVAVFSSPVYYGDVSGQFKTFFDRTWSFTQSDYQTSRLLPGKKAVFILTQAGVETLHTDVIERYSKYLNLYGYEVNTIRAVECGVERAADVKKQITKVSELAENIVE